MNRHKEKFHSGLEGDGNYSMENTQTKKVKKSRVVKSATFVKQVGKISIISVLVATSSIFNFYMK